MIAVAAVFGLLAVFVAQSWLNSQAEAQRRNVPTQQGPQVAARTLVVAAKTLRFGNELTADMLREVAWPDGAPPPGAFTKISDLLTGGKRVVLTAIEANEPVLAMKITGAGQRATLSALVAAGMKAVTIRVNDVDGGGGFVLPGDRVDIVMTRQEKENASSQVLLQDVRVLAVDQNADERAANPAVAKSVTVEVDMVAGQKLGAGGFRRHPFAPAAQGRREFLGQCVAGDHQGPLQRRHRRHQAHVDHGRGHARHRQVGPLHGAAGGRRDGERHGESDDSIGDITAYGPGEARGISDGENENEQRDQASSRGRQAAPRGQEQAGVAGGGEGAALRP